MIQIRCANCEGLFHANDEAEGTVERCPDCGAMNDVPSFESDATLNDEVPFAPTATDIVHLKQRRGMPSPIFWLISVVLIGGFVAALTFIFSPDWETEHLPAFSSLVTSGDVAVSQRDYELAVRKYQSAIDLAENHTIQSAYLQRLLQHARQSLADAKITEQKELNDASSRPQRP